MLEQQLQAKVLDDVHGLVTYQDPPRTRFVRAEVTATGIKSVETFLTDFDALFHANPVFPPKQELAIDLYGASQFEASTRARFLTLLVAVEALLEPCDRSPGAQELVRSLIEQTAGSNLPNAEKDSIVGSLNWLFKESIRKSGGRLAQRFSDRRSMAERARRISSLIATTYEVSLSTRVVSTILTQTCLVYATNWNALS